MLSRPIEKIVGVVALSLAMVSTGMAAERAASIEYETVGRPVNLQADFIAPQDSSFRFLAIKEDIASAITKSPSPTRSPPGCRIKNQKSRDRAEA
jgi:hypothetical protein